MRASLFSATVLLTTVASVGCGAMHSRVALGPAPKGSCRAVVSTSSSAAAPASILPTLRWTAPEDIEHRNALGAWCTAVGPAVVEPLAARAPAVPSGPAATASELVIVSWNVHVGAGDVVGLVEQLRAGRFTDGRPVDRFVLMLQETYRQGDVVPRGADPRATPKAIQPHTAGRRIDIVEVAGVLNLSLYYAPSMRNGPGQKTSEDRGNAILSTEPLTDLEAVELPFERQRRVALQATITLPAAGSERQTLRLTNVHLENRGAGWHLGLLSPVARLTQASALMDRVPATGGAVLGGDLNSWFGALEPAYRRLAANFDAQWEVDGRRTFSGLLRLDHLFVRLPVGWDARTIRLARFGSDHHPLLAWLRATPGGI